MVGGDQPLILQYTVSSQNGIEAAPIKQLLARLGPDRCKAARLVFVVPPKQFDKFDWQPWQSADGCELQAVPQELQSMQQWVMELKVQPSPSSSV